MKKIESSLGIFLVFGVSIISTISVNACTPSPEPCPTVFPVPAIGPIMCNLCADRLKVSDTVDTCNLLVQGDAHILGNLRVEGNLCCGSEPCVGTSMGAGSEVEEGVITITGKQFRFTSQLIPNFDGFIYPIIVGCSGVGTMVTDPPLVIGVPLPADFDESSSNPVVIDVHFVGPINPSSPPGTGDVPFDWDINSFVTVIAEGESVAVLPTPQTDSVTLTPFLYHTEFGLIIVPDSSNLQVGTLLQIGFCTQGSESNPFLLPRLAGLTIHYPKLP